MLDKAIEHNKEHRKPYYDCRAFNVSCRNHGSDNYMCKNRQFNKIKNAMTKQDILKSVDE